MATGNQRIPAPCGVAPASRGFTYISILLTVALVGTWLGAVSDVWHLQLQREREAELLFVGHEFRAALESYAMSSAGASKRLPNRLEELVLDDRVPSIRRHLRRIYIDPMTGSADWGLVRNAQGQILGVHSLSTDKPIKVAGFDIVDAVFAGRTSYSEWVFLASSGLARPAVRVGITAPPLR